MTSEADRLAQEIERLFTTLVSRRTRLGGGEASTLTPTQRNALASVVDNGSLRLGTLATEMGTTDATATRTVDALEADGLVRRTADRADRRGVLVEATPAGSRLIAERRRQLVTLLDEPLSRLPRDEQARFVNLLRELNVTLAADDGTPILGANDQARRFVGVSEGRATTGAGARRRGRATERRRS